MRQPKIVIIDYGAGNTRSVINALRYLGYRRYALSRERHEIIDSDALILPGVGAFGNCMDNLKQAGLVSILGEAVLERGKPILGICIGMQLMADSSDESPGYRGLGWIPGEVKKLKVSSEYAVPHVGWNDITFEETCPIFSKNMQGSDFYFDHSYAYNCDSEYIVSTTHYCSKVTAAISRGNIFGVQFHPEKSHNEGLRLIRSFISMSERC